MYQWWSLYRLGMTLLQLRDRYAVGGKFRKRSKESMDMISLVAGCKAKTKTNRKEKKRDQAVREEGISSMSLNFVIMPKRSRIMRGTAHNMILATLHIHLSAIVGISNDQVIKWRPPKTKKKDSSTASSRSKDAIASGSRLAVPTGGGVCAQSLGSLPSAVIRIRRYSGRKKRRIKRMTIGLSKTSS